MSERKTIADYLTMIPDEKKTLIFRPYGAIDYGLFESFIMDHFEELTFEEYFKLRQLSNLDQIKELLDIIADNSEENL